jgi:hypothetical protein
MAGRKLPRRKPTMAYIIATMVGALLAAILFED